MTDPLGTIGHRYVIQEVLGEGGMGTVYLAQDLKHDRQVAVKTIHPHLATTHVQDRFEREIRITARLQHPHILPLLDSGVAGETLYYVMPYVEGESLRDRLKRESGLPEREVIQIGRDVASALDYAHQHDVIHRDIKPENILLTSDRAIVADFGISKAVGETNGGTLTQSGMLVGTPAYMPPEQYGGDVTGRSDIYALGTVLYEALTSRRWLLGTTVDEADWSGVNPKMRSGLARALELSPEDRWEDAGAFRNALTAGGRNGSVPPEVGEVAAQGTIAELLDEVSAGSPLSSNLSVAIAMTHIGMDSKDEAFLWLDRSAELRSTILPFVLISPVGRRLEGDPRYVALLERVRLPTQVPERGS